MTRFRFSTDDLPPGQRLSVWREVFGEKIARLDMEAPRDQPFSGNVTVAAFQGLCVGLTATTANSIARTRRLIDDGSDDIMLGVMLKGAAAVSQQGQDEVHVAAGEAVVWSNASAGGSHYPAPIEFLSVAIPRALLVPSLTFRDSARLSVISSRSEPMRLLTAYLQLMLRDGFPPELQAASVAYVHELVGVILDGQGAALGSRGEMRTARLYAIKQDIAQRLRQRDLSVTGVALRHGMAPRTIRDLFAGEGTTFTDYVLNLRLTQIYRALANPRFTGRTISAIAFEFGFGDLSYFNLAFRRRFGVTPSDIRAVARQ